MHFIIIIFVFLFFFLSSLAANEHPKRVVSLNLCTDQLVLGLLDRNRIVSVTYLATDPTISYLAERARGIPQNHGLAEEILPLKPDLILAGAFTSRPTTALLKRLGYRVVIFEMALSFDTLRLNIMKAGVVLREEKKATLLVDKFNQDVEKIHPISRIPISVIVLQPRSAGVGQLSLLGDIFRTVGFNTFSVTDETMEVGWVTLDRIIQAQPELIISEPDPPWPSLGHLAMRHPAYEAVRNKQGRVPTRVNLPTNLWNCGGPQVAKAISILAKARAAALDQREVK